MTLPKNTQTPGPGPQAVPPYPAKADVHAKKKEALGAAGGWAFGAIRDACAEAFNLAFEFPEFEAGKPPTPEQVADQERLLHRLRDTLALAAVALDGLDPAGSIGVDVRT